MSAFLIIQHLISVVKQYPPKSLHSINQLHILKAMVFSGYYSKVLLELCKKKSWVQMLLPEFQTLVDKIKALFDDPWDNPADLSSQIDTIEELFNRARAFIYHDFGEDVIASFLFKNSKTK